ACIFSLEAIYDWGLKRPYAECAEWSKNVVEWLSQERPDLVLISHSPGTDEVTAEGLARLWKKLADMGLDVRLVRNIPWLLLEPGECLERRKDWRRKCLPVRSEVLTEDVLYRAAKLLNV